MSATSRRASPWTSVWRRPHSLLGRATVLALPLLAATAAAVAGPGTEAITGQDHPGDVTAVEGQYVPNVVHIQQGERFTFGNYDARAGIPAHSIVEVVPQCTDAPYIGNNAGQGTCRYPQFTTGVVDHGYVLPVRGVEDLPPGRYKFTCQVHPQMHGTLVVEPGSQQGTRTGRGHHSMGHQHMSPQLNSRHVYDRTSTDVRP